MSIKHLSTRLLIPIHPYSDYFFKGMTCSISTVNCLTGYLNETRGGYLDVKR